MNIAVYARVSTQRQAEGQTILQRLERLQAYVQAQGWTILPHHLYRDEGYSGTRLDRPALDRLRDAAERGEFQTVVITTPDRLARRFVHQTLLLEELAQLGCQVVFLDRPISQDPHEQLLYQIRGAVAEYERALIADRTRRGRLAKLRAGQLLPWIHTPYGYRCDPQYPRDPTRLRIEESEASVVRQMFLWYAEEGLSIHAIAARLMELHIPTYHGQWHWRPATVRGMLSNEVYAGTAYGNRDYDVEPHRQGAEQGFIVHGWPLSGNGIPEEERPRRQDSEEQEREGRKFRRPRMRAGRSIERRPYLLCHFSYTPPQNAGKIPGTKTAAAAHRLLTLLTAYALSVIYEEGIVLVLEGKPVPSASQPR
jgi:site-specific DNA recombinase